jgi:predicted thioredoxin/glutaredoxin
MFILKNKLNYVLKQKADGILNEETVSAINKAKLALCFISKDYTKSIYNQLEINYLNEKEKKLVIVLCEGIFSFNYLKIKFIFV